jgi:hypothetical protein
LLPGGLGVFCVSAVFFERLGKIEGGANSFCYVGYLLHCGAGHFFVGVAFAQD